MIYRLEHYTTLYGQHIYSTQGCYDVGDLYFTYVCNATYYTRWTLDSKLISFITVIVRRTNHRYKDILHIPYLFISFLVCCWSYISLHSNNCNCFDKKLFLTLTHKKSKEKPDLFTSTAIVYWVGILRFCVIPLPDAIM